MPRKKKINVHVLAKQVVPDCSSSREAIRICINLKIEFLSKKLTITRERPLSNKCTYEENST